MFRHLLIAVLFVHSTVKRSVEVDAEDVKVDFAPRKVL
jgi:hypothetical protein